MYNKQVERKINEIYKKIYKEVFNTQNVNFLASGSRIDIEQSLLKIQSSQKFRLFAEKFSLELAKNGLNRERGIWRKYYEASKKIGNIALPLTYKEFEYKNMAEAISHNFKMITSIPEKMMEIMQHKYTSNLIEEVAKGTISRGSFRKQLEKHGIKQAQLIARTETAKLQTEITKTRATSLGSKAYIWVSSNDKRTRPSHREMNGVVVFWRSSDLEKPLLDGFYCDAGTSINCRCDAQPIMDLEDLNKSTYKVYDYNVHKIITMSHYNLIKALEKGEL